MMNLLNWMTGRNRALFKRYSCYAQLRCNLFGADSRHCNIDYPRISDHSLSIIVGGYEKGGTTLTKDLLSLAGLGDCCFECGVLLFPPPALKQYPLGDIDDVLPGFRASWGLSDSFEADYQLIDNYEDLYNLIKRSAKNYTYKDIPIIDKYPRYMMYLDKVMAHAPSSKVIIVLRRPEYVVASWLALGRSIEEAISAVSYSNFGLISAIAKHPSNHLLILRYEDLLLEPCSILNRFGFNICNQAFSEALSWVEAIGTPSITGGASNVLDLNRDSISFKCLEPSTQLLILEELASRSEVKVLNRLTSGPVSKMNLFLFKHFYKALEEHGFES